MQYKPALAVFDVCGTLVKANTTYDFLTEYHRSRARYVDSYAWRRKFFQSRRSPGFWGTAAVERLIRRDITRSILVKTLKGQRVSNVCSAAEGYAAKEIARSGQTNILDRLRAHQVDGDRVILASSSVEPVVEAFATVLGTEYIASTLEIDDWHYTGRLTNDLTGQKDRLLVDRLGLNQAHGDVYVYSDNLTDQSLLRLADYPVVVLKDIATRDRWADFKAEYVVVS